MLSSQLKVNPPILYNCDKELSEKDEGWARIISVSYSLYFHFCAIYYHENMVN